MDAATGASLGRQYWAWTLPRLCRDVPLAPALVPHARSALEADAHLVRCEGSRFGLAAFPPTLHSKAAEDAQARHAVGRKLRKPRTPP